MSVWAEVFMLNQLKQELITYRIKDGMLRKEITSRKFNLDQTDWHDSMTVDPMFKISEE